MVSLIQNLRVVYPRIFVDVQKLIASKSKFVIRDLSWLTFNGRVLQEAEDSDNHLHDRLKFLGIFSNNLDEFFRVRES